MLLGSSGLSGSPGVTGGCWGTDTIGCGSTFGSTLGGGVTLPSVTSTAFCVSVEEQPANAASTAMLQNSFFIGYHSLSWAFDQWAPSRFTHITRFRAEPLAHAAIAGYRG